MPTPKPKPIPRDEYFLLRTRIEAILLNCDDDLPLEVVAQIQAFVGEAPGFIEAINAATKD